MQKLIILILLACFVFSTHPGFAARGGEKGADQEAYEHASDRAIFHRVSDWFTTIGKSKEEKKAIIEERKAKRAQKKAEKKAEIEARKEQKRGEKKVRKEKKEAEKAQRKAKKKGQVPD